MEDNNTSQNLPTYCANGCGFYGNPINNNMCSKCFKEVSAKNSSADSSTAVATSTGAVGAPSLKPTEPELPPLTLLPAAASPPPSTAAPAQPSSVPAPPSAVLQQQPSPMDYTPTPTSVPVPSFSPSSPSPPSLPSSSSQPTASLAMDSSAPGERPVQANKGRCFMCRAKIPLAKQAINKCRCEYVFCDTHKAIDKHDCDYDFAKMGRDLLAKANPKLNDKPRGGRSFTRLE